jgi:spoIIIJ-associated protein
VKTCAEAQARLREILDLMGFGEASLEVGWDIAQERVRISVESAQPQQLVGREGRTLESLQFLLAVILSRRLGISVAVQVDAGGYWEKREREVLSEAQRGIEQVKSTGKPFRLLPMDAMMRRLVHRTLAEHPDVLTASEGEGPWRKIVLRPRRH